MSNKIESIFGLAKSIYAPRDGECKVVGFGCVNKSCKTGHCKWNWSKAKCSCFTVPPGSKGDGYSCAHSKTSTNCYQSGAKWNGRCPCLLDKNHHDGESNPLCGGCACRNYIQEVPAYTNPYYCDCTSSCSK